MTIRFGIIGLGNRGYKYALKTIQQSPDCEIEMVCDVAGKNFHQFEGVSTTRIYQEVLDNPNVDAVFIATPDGTHAEIIAACIRADKHILCEKPVEITEEKLKKIYQQAKDYSKVIEIGYVLRYARLFKKVKEFLENGVIGELVMVRATDHIPYGGYAYFHDWHRQRSLSGSLLLQKATHTLDLVNWYADSQPSEIMGFGGLAVMGEPGAQKKFGKPVDKALRCRDCLIKETCEESIVYLAKEKGLTWGEEWPDSCVFSSEVDVEDHQSIMIRYKNDVKLSYQLCQFSGFYQREFQFYGTMGELHFDDQTNEITIYSRTKQEIVTYKSSYVEKNMEPGDAEQLEDFVQAIQTGTPPLSTLKSGVIAGLTAIAAQKSIDTMEIQTLPVF